ncbi:MAG: histidine phosphatase family protein [Pirellulaceae bacterium]|nr:histidine phosphatase family protein [Pirellulaceae bacterium]
MSHILLIRHAQSANNALPMEQRVCDPGLTPLGYQQAQAIARSLAGYPLRKLYCSPFLRSLETTRLIAEATGLVAEIRSDLFEEGGCYSGYLDHEKRGEQGMGRDELLQRYPEWNVDPRIGQQGWWGRPFESKSDAQRRALSVRHWLESSIVEPGSHVDALVIHADFKRLLLIELLGQAWSEAQHQQFGSLINTGLSSLEFCCGTWIMHSFNSGSHLKHHHLSS